MDRAQKSKRSDNLQACRYTIAVAAAKVDAAALKEQEERQRVLNAVGEHGGREGITLTKLMDHISMRRGSVARHLATLKDSHAVEICGEYRGGSKWRVSSWNEG